MSKRQLIDWPARPVLRAGLVVFGPSLALDLLAAGAVGVTAGGLLGWRPARQLPRRLRLLAAAGTGLVAAYLLAVRPWHLGWGATAAERRRSLPGDELVPAPAVQSTRAVTIAAPAADVWSWLVQLGQGRGGFYSYDWLENLAGCDLLSADRIHPEWQNVRAGDFIRAMPATAMPEAGWRVARLDAGRALVLAGWGAFVVEPLDAATTRLIARSRGGGRPRLLTKLLNTLTWEIPHFIMERRMLLGIKQRAERAERAARAAEAARQSGRRPSALSA